MYRVPDLKLVVMASKDHERVFKSVSRDFNIFQTLSRSSFLKEIWEPSPGFIRVCFSQSYYKKNIGDTVIYYFQWDIFVSRVDGDGRHRGQTAGGKFTKRTSK